MKSVDVPDNRIFIERFSTDEGDTSVQRVAANLTALLEGETVKVDIEPNQTVLRSLIEAGHNPPYSVKAVFALPVCASSKRQSTHEK